MTDERATVLEQSDRSTAGLTGESRNESDELDVLMVPDYRGSNPYQAALMEGLEARDVNVRTATAPGLLFPITRLTVRDGVPDLFHIHFFTPYMIVGDERLHRLGLASPATFALGTMLLVELLLLRLRGVTTVWTVHDLVSHERHAVRAEVAIKHVAARFVLDRLIVHCDTAGEEVRQRFGLPAETAGKFEVIPHGHFLDEYPDEIDRAEARSRLGVDTDGPVFLFFGWIRPYKNVPRLLQHFKRLEDPDARLLVVGSTRSADLETTLCDLGADDSRVKTVLEFVPDEDVQVYMNAADVVVLPFQTEGRTLLTSGSVLLAMGFENAVVAPDIGCIGAVLDDEGGVCYDPDGTDQPLSAMRNLADADLAAMGAHNRQVVEALDWDTIARRTQRTYDEVTE